MDNNSWERLSKIIEWAGMSTHAFAMKIGMKRSENLYRIIRNKENVSIKLAMLILQSYPQVNRNWLIYGEGDMIVDEDDIDISGNKIPYYAQSLESNIENLSSAKPVSKIYVPMLKSADFAIDLMDKAMEPVIQSGAIILLKKQSTDFIVFGQIYYIVTDDLSMARVIRKCEESNDDIILEAANSSRYDSIRISKSNIKALYYISGTINRF